MKKTLHKYLFFFSICLLFSVACMETDMYVPGLPSMKAELATTEAMVEFALSVNFLAICVTSLFFGPLSDAFGRRRIIISGIFVLTLGSFGCTAASSIEWILFFRAIQGIGAGAIFGIGPALLFDRYPENEAASLVAGLNSVITLSMAGAPILGSFILLHYGWRMNFGVIAGLSTVCLLLYIFVVPETLSKDKRVSFSLGGVLRNYLKLTMSFRYMANTLAFCLIYAGIILYVSNLSLIFIDNLKVPAASYTWYQFSIMGAFGFASLAASRIIKKIGTERTQITGNSLVAIGALGLGLVTLMAPTSPLLITLSMIVFSTGTALSIPIFYLKALSIYPEIKGAANAYSQSFRLGVTGLMVALSGHFFTGTIGPVAIIITSATLLGFMLILGLKVSPATPEETIS